MTIMIKLMTVLGIDEGDGDVNGSERRTADSGSAVHGGGGGGTYFRQNLTVAIVVVLLNRLEFWSRVSTRVSHGRMSSGQQGFSQFGFRVQCSGQLGQLVNPGQTRSNQSTAVNWLAVVRVRLFQSRSMQFGSVRAVRFRVPVKTRSTDCQTRSDSVNFSQRKMR
ncbi:hypothetical protein HanPI659440_Chr06g0250691 [Helianthus annuus]|nr:hypothetical protein HanPI659440_Chr06g0250691 [Helianthus annuus]